MASVVTTKINVFCSCFYCWKLVHIIR